MSDEERVSEGYSRPRVISLTPAESDDATFDSGDGEPVTCPQCQADNPPGATLCLACGADLTSPPPAEASRALEIPIINGYASTRPIRQRSRTGSPLSCIAILALLGTALLVGLFIQAPSTTVTVVPDRQLVIETVQIKADPGVRVMDVEKRTIPARVVNSEISGGDQVTLAKKREVISGRAQGQVVFANRSDIAVPVSRGTVVRVGNSGPRFETTEEVLVPGMVFGAARVSVRSLVEGPDGNTGKLTISTIEGSLGTMLYVGNDLPLVGGEKRTVTYVTTEDRARLHELVLSKLKDEVYPKLRLQINATEFLPPESVKVLKIVEEIYDKNVNDEAEVLNLRMRVSYDGTAVEGARANDLAIQALDRKAKPGYVVQPQSIQISPREVQRVDGNVVYFLMEVQGSSVATVDEASIRRELSGKTQSEAQAYLSSVRNLAETPKVEIFPDWLGRVARLDLRLYIHIVPKPSP